jgi:hypothetical protein
MHCISSVKQNNCRRAFLSLERKWNIGQHCHQKIITPVYHVELKLKRNPFSWHNPIIPALCLHDFLAWFPFTPPTLSCRTRHKHTMFSLSLSHRHSARWQTQVQPTPSPATPHSYYSPLSPRCIIIHQLCRSTGFPLFSWRNRLSKDWLFLFRISLLLWKMLGTGAPCLVVSTLNSKVVSLVGNGFPVKNYSISSIW